VSADEQVSVQVGNNGSVHLAYNPSFSACFFSRNSVFLSSQISQQCFSAGLSAQPNGANVVMCTAVANSPICYLILVHWNILHLFQSIYIYIDRFGFFFFRFEDVLVSIH
jgi:hypothetical protein